MNKYYKKCFNWWNSYRYRFIPWIIYSWQNRSVRCIDPGATDKHLSDVQVERSLFQLFSAFYGDCSTFVTPANLRSEKSIKQLPFTDDQVYNEEKSFEVPNLDGGSRLQEEKSLSVESVLHHKNLHLLKKHCGFTVERRPSRIEGGGTGVFVTSGSIPPDTVVALYPGVVYNPGEPLLLQSFGNAFIFRCIDGIHIDGNDHGISKVIFRSCSHRDKIGLLFTSDLSWLTLYPVNPLAVGQYVNNSYSANPANVCYQEFDFSEKFPDELRQFIPNVNFSASPEGVSLTRAMRTVALVSLRQIETGEELLSSYYTIVHQ